MVIAIIGESCAGKSTLANALAPALGARTVTGRDYLRMAKSPAQAERLFRAMLAEAVEGENLLYVISEPEELSLLPEGAKRIVVRADLDTIKARFRARMRGHLPKSVEEMLERRHGQFDGERYDYLFDGAAGDADALCAALLSKERKEGQ